MYSCNYPKRSNEFIKQEQISDYVISRKSELSIGPQSQELSLSENSMLNWLSCPFLVFLRLVIIVILGDLKVLLVNGHYIHFYEKIKLTIVFISAQVNNLFFCTPWKHQKSYGFLMFSVGIERGQ